MKCRSWKLPATFGLLTLTLAVGANGFAAPRRGGDTDPPDGGDSDEPTKEPIERPSTKPHIPGYVLSNDAYYRERTLPLCEWGQGERSFYDQFIRDQRWMCSLGLSRDPETGDWVNQACSFSEAADVRPADATYSLLPFDFPDYLSEHLAWPDGSAAYAGWGISCARNPSSGAVSDKVVRSTFVGTWLNGDTCPGWPHQGRRALLVAQLVGGDVEHVRPAIVRAQANVGYFAYGGRNLPDDLQLAIQVFGNAGWQDFATVTRTTGPQPKHFELEATVPEGSFVRVQLRGTLECIGGYHNGDGYDIRSLRVQVETCIPDQSNPGNCL